MSDTHVTTDSFTTAFHPHDDLFHSIIFDSLLHNRKKIKDGS